MPVAEQVRVSTHTGNGVTTNFAYGFRIFADTDLTVTVDGVVQTLTTDYTVNGANDAGGGTIDFVTAPINLSVVTLSGELAYDRIIDYIQNGSILAGTSDNDHDKAVMLIQQLRRDVKRSIKVPIEETTDQEVSFTPANRANKILAFDSAGLPVASPITDLSSILTTVDTSLALSGGILSVAIPNRQAVAGGTVDAITATFVPAIAALVNNIEVVVEAGGANATTTPTFTPDGLTPKTIVKGSNSPLVPGDIAGADFRMHLVFDATLDKWILLNPVNPARLLLPQSSSPSAPTLAFGDGDSGWYEDSDDDMRAAIAGIAQISIQASWLRGTSNDNFAIKHSGTLSYVVPDYTWINDTDTGMVHGAANEVGFAVGGAEAVRATALGFAGLLLNLRASQDVADSPVTTSDFHDIPAWVQEITIMLVGVSVDGTQIPMIQLGTGTSGSPVFETSSYGGASTNLGTGVTSKSHSAGFLLNGAGSAAITYTGVLTLVRQAGNRWNIGVKLGDSAGAATMTGGGTKLLSAPLTQIRLTSESSPDDFDGGAWSIRFK